MASKKSFKQSLDIVSEHVSPQRVNENQFNRKLKLLLQGAYRYTQNLSGELAHVVKANPSIIKHHITSFARLIGKADEPVAIRRNLLRLLDAAGNISANEKLVDTCFRILENRHEPVALRAYAMSILARQVRQQQELRSQLLLIIDSEEQPKPAFTARAKQVKKLLRKSEG
jgi:hypothetical protein